MCVRLLAGVERTDGGDDGDLALAGDGSVVDGLVGLEGTPVLDYGHAVPSLAAQQGHVVATPQALVRTDAVLAVTLRGRRDVVVDCVERLQVQVVVGDHDVRAHHRWPVTHFTDQPLHVTASPQYHPM